MKIIDCKKLNCPLPVVNTKKYFDSIESGEATIVVDNETAKNNVMKFAKKQGYETSNEDKEDAFYIKIKKGKNKDKKDKSQNKKFTIVVTNDKLGHGNDELGKILMKSYIFALSQADIIPTDLIFINGWVNLTVEDSHVLDSLNKLNERGTKIQVCGTCLDFYQLKEKVAIGEISNMYTIVETMNESDKTIKL